MGTAAILILAALLAFIGGMIVRNFGMRSQSVSQAKRTIIQSKRPPVVAAQVFREMSPADAEAENAGIPLVTLHPVPAAAFHFQGTPRDRDRATDCLAAAAWYEAGDDARNERAVIQTVLNRTRHPAFPASVCGVVFQGTERQTGCQFTFTCDGALRRQPSAAAWDRARKLATDALDGAVDGDVGYATHYHADYVVPYWQDSLDKIAVVGLHIFYRWPGPWGQPRAFSRKPADGEPAIQKLAFLSPAHLPDVALSDSASPAATDSARSTPTEPLTAPAPLLPAGSTALRGSHVGGASGDGRIITLALDPAAFAGSYALTALALCGNKRSCLVLGWRDGADVATGLPLDDQSLQKLSFLYLRNLHLGLERTLWNCRQISGIGPDKCMPTVPSDIEALFRLD
jgi:spore germination cell wall hydrolase CwlJ-like protein